MRSTPVTSTKGAFGNKKSQCALPSFHLLFISAIISGQETIMNFSISLSRISELHRNMVKFYFQANLGRHNINIILICSIEVYWGITVFTGFK